VVCRLHQARLRETRGLPHAHNLTYSHMQESLSPLTNKSSNKHATVVHVTASSVSSQSLGLHRCSNASTLFGQDSAELLEDYERLFCPQPGTKESDALGIVSCVDGEQGAFRGGDGGNHHHARSPCHPQLQGAQHQVCEPHSSLPLHIMHPMSQSSSTHTTSSASSSPFSQSVLGQLYQSHQPLYAQPKTQIIDLSSSHPPISWAMRVSSPRPREQQGVDGGVAMEYAEEPPEILVGLDAQYQPYCKQVITPALNLVTTIALERLRNIQQEIESSMLGLPGVTKASIPRKYFCSLKEVSKVAKICKLLVIAPDIKPSPTAHIKPVKMLISLIEDAEIAGVPYVFALSRKGIGQIFGKDKNMSIMALMDLDPIRAEAVEMLEEASLGRRLWAEKCRASGWGLSVDELTQRHE
jgi:ribosomal protein L7Ae-like RNA K-turn-binding protein